jgi:hypothetical protein
MAHAEVKIKDTCMFGPATGKVVHTQTFPQNPDLQLFWVVIPTRHQSVGYWYSADCLEVTKGRLPALPKKGTEFRHKIEKDGNVAHFFIDKATKDVLIADGYTVTYEP